MGGGVWGGWGGWGGVGRCGDHKVWGDVGRCGEMGAQRLRGARREGPQTAWRRSSAAAASLHRPSPAAAAALGRTVASPPRRRCPAVPRTHAPPLQGRLPWLRRWVRVRARRPRSRASASSPPPPRPAPPRARSGEPPRGPCRDLWRAGWARAVRVASFGHGCELPGARSMILSAPSAVSTKLSSFRSRVRVRVRVRVRLAPT